MVPISDLLKTSIPTLLVFFGLTLIILAVIGRIGRYINLSKIRTILAYIIGGLLLIFGIIWNIMQDNSGFQTVELITPSNTETLTTTIVIDEITLTPSLTYTLEPSQISTITPSATNTIEPTQTPMIVKELTIDSKNMEVVFFTFPYSGTYRIEHNENTYSTGPTSKKGKPYRTLVYAYRTSDEIYPGGPYNEPQNPAFPIGCPWDLEDELANINCAKNNPWIDEFIAGDEFKFITIDDMGSYSDCDGEITISIILLSSH